MAFDAVFLRKIKNEIEKQVLNARIDKITQHAKDEFILHFAVSGNKKLLLSANAQSARIHFTNAEYENPQTPPLFCILLRKYLKSARLKEINQVNGDRILSLVFSGKSEIGDDQTVKIVIEIMGKYSNIMLLNEDGKILDALKKTSLDSGENRAIFSGIGYELPPKQEKQSIFEVTTEDIIRTLKENKDTPIDKAVMNKIHGISPIISREIAFCTSKTAKPYCELSEEERDRLYFYCDNLLRIVNGGSFNAVMLLDEDKKPKDLTFIPVNQYGEEMSCKAFESLSRLAEEFYKKRDNDDRIKQRSGDLFKLIQNARNRVTNRVAAQKQELLECEKMEDYKNRGDILSANMYMLKQGMNSVKLQNFYDQQGGDITIELDNMLTPSQNVQKYYNMYRKLATAQKKLKVLIADGEREEEYLSSVFESLSRAFTREELEAIRAELSAGGYIKKKRMDKGKKMSALKPLVYKSGDGFTIYSGRNNTQNDKLTLKDSAKNDIWLHTQKIPGSHVIIAAQGKEVPETTLMQAAVIAAYNSKASGSAKVPVDYTLVRYVKKPNGARPGMVIYDNFKTIFVTPDEEEVEKLKAK